MPHIAPAAEAANSVSWLPEEMLPPPSVSGEPVSLCHWLSTEAAFADTGGLVSGDQLVELLHAHSRPGERVQAQAPIALVARWIVQKRVVSIDSPWGPILPVFQFDLQRATVHPGVQLVLAELKGVLDDLELALWFVTPNDWLEGRRPVHGVKNRMAALQRAARADRYVALGG